MYEIVLKTAVPVYGRLMMRKHFDGLYVQGLEQATAAARRGPVIFAANHVCWWDGILMLTLAPRLRVRNRFLVDATSVDKIGFLEQFGAIGIDRTSVTSPIAGMEQAASWLDGPRKSLWVYPQGRYRPPHMRPLELQRGVALLQRLSGATVIPVTVSLGYFLTHLPACAITFGAPLKGGRSLMDDLEAAMLAQLDEQDAFFDQDHPKGPFQVEVRSASAPIEDSLASRVAAGIQTTARRARSSVRRRVLRRA